MSIIILNNKTNMNKIINLILVALVLLTACNTSQDQDSNSDESTVVTEQAVKVDGINFHEGNWESALAKAKAENKLVFLDISASWCGPCKQLKKTTFKDAAVGEFYNDKFINVELDGEKGEGIALAQKYRLQGYPSLYFIDVDGNVVKETAGFLPAEQFIEYGKSVTN